MGRLPDDWDRSIPDGSWPETLISAVRSDVRALASERALATIQRWRDSVLHGEHSGQAREAKVHLLLLARAIMGFESTEPEQIALASAEDVFETSGIGDAFTADAFTADAFSASEASELRRETFAVGEDDLSDPGRSTEPPELERVGSPVREGAWPRSAAASTPPLKPEATPEFIPCDDAILEAEPSPSIRSRSPTTGSALPSHHDFAEEDEKPTRLQLPEREPTRGLQAGAAVDPQVGDENPTAAILLPENLHRRSELGHFGASGVEAQSDPAESAEREPLRAAHAIRPKPGLVRRAVEPRKKPEHPRPRAAMQQVKALHTVLLPLCEELIPLSAERRSRRFWARWREVAADRGVRREFVEDLLYEARDLRALLCELIAEVQSVDPKSVYTLVDRIHSGDGAPPGSGRLDALPERQRGPMVGASVRVQGVPPRDEES